MFKSTARLQAWNITGLYSSSVFALASLFRDVVTIMTITMRKCINHQRWDVAKYQRRLHWSKHVQIQRFAWWLFWNGDLWWPFPVVYLSCPAVSQICRLVFSPSTSIFLIWKSTPINHNPPDSHLTHINWNLCIFVPYCERHLTPSSTYPKWSEYPPWIHLDSDAVRSLICLTQHLLPEPACTFELGHQTPADLSPVADDKSSILVNTIVPYPENPYRVCMPFGVNVLWLQVWQVCAKWQNMNSSFYIAINYLKKGCNICSHTSNLFSVTTTAIVSKLN